MQTIGFVRTARHAVALLCVLVVTPSSLAVAIDGGAEDDDGEQLVLEQYLLTVDDLPEGWTVLPPPPASAPTTPSYDTSACVVALDLPDRSSVPTAYVQFLSADSTASVIHLVARRSGSVDLVEATEAMITACPTFEIGGVTARYAEIDFPAKGDSSMAVRITLSGAGLGTEFVQVVISRGPFDLSIVLGGPDPDLDDVEQYVDVALRRLPARRPTD